MYFSVCNNKIWFFWGIVSTEFYAIFSNNFLNISAVSKNFFGDWKDFFIRKTSQINLQK